MHKVLFHLQYNLERVGNIFDSIRALAGPIIDIDINLEKIMMHIIKKVREYAS